MWSAVYSGSRLKEASVHASIRQRVRCEEAFESDQPPRVALRAAYESALAYCSLSDCERFAVDLA